MLSVKQRFFKRIFDIVLSAIGLVVLFIPMVIFIVLASFSTKSFGVYRQKRVGRHAKLFTMYKIKSMITNTSVMAVTTSSDTRITPFGTFLRKRKIDELPQLFNVFKGDMSIVGPRPDVEGYADVLQGEDRIILSVKPGLTGPATLQFSNEEQLLSKQKDPLTYNDEVIWPQKVALNKTYVMEYSIVKDMHYILLTIGQLFR